MTKYRIYYSARVQFSKVMEGDEPWDSKMINYIDDNFPVDSSCTLEWWEDEQVDAVEEVLDD